MPENVDYALTLLHSQADRMEVCVDALDMMDIVTAYERAVALLIAPGSGDAADWARLTARDFLSELVDVDRLRDLSVKYEPSDEQMDEQFAAIQREREAAKLEANAGVIWIEE
jgi:hypothetical protein